MTHTPGPWIAEEEEYGRSGAVTGIYVAFYDTERERPDGRICKAFGNCRVTTDEAVRANARLIAAAPDLLAALKELVADVEGYDAWERPCRAVDVARAAIAKATGAEGR